MYRLLSEKLDMVIRIQDLDEIFCCSHSGNTLKKYMIPTILVPVMGKCSGRLCSLTLVWQQLPHQSL